jgi:hypothetical protein
MKFLSREDVGCSFLFIGGIILVDIIGMGISMLLPAVQAAREAGRRVNCSHNLQQIAVAMMNYREQNGCFPPAFVADKNGKPMHSWRALLLPYLEGGFESPGSLYKYDEPWDSPRNRKITDLPLTFYQCPSQADRKQPTTSYMMVVGPHTVSDGPHSRKIEDITDGTVNTVMVVEVADSGVGWAEPKDLEFDKIDFKINGEKRPGIGSCHSGGAFVAFFCGGRVEFVENATSPERVKAMLTIDGREKATGERRP